MSRYILLDPGAIAEPMNDTVELTTSISFRAWKVSDAEEMTGATTAWTKESALGTQVCVDVLWRLSPMLSSYISFQLLDKFEACEKVKLTTTGGP